MDPILEEVYSIIVPSAPYVIAAYVLIWAVLFVFIIVMLRRAKKTQKDIDALNEAIEYRERRRAEKGEGSK